MRQFARLLALTVFIGCLAVVTGCSSNTPNGNIAQIRTVDACPNGGTATVFINEGTANGTQNFFQTSPYLFIGSGAVGFQFSLSTQPSITYTAANGTIVDGAAYSAVVVGRADVTDEIDARYPKLLLLQDDTGSAPAGSADVRLINAAPDSPNVDFLVGGTTEASSLSYAHVSDYVSVLAGVRSVQINQSGTNTALAGPQNITLAAGKHYTVYFVEPNVTTPTYGIQLLNDNP